MKQLITVVNIKCGGCVNSIKSALLKIENVQEVSIDIDAETISIKNVNPIDRTLIVKQLKKMGYPEKDSNNLLLKAKSFVSCAFGNLTKNNNLC
jgi:copper chaperone